MSINFAGDETNYPADVRLVDATDPVLGGEDGAANLAAQDLADRTAYLNAKRLADFTAGIEAASGGMATVKEDDNGNWHVMARIPAFKSEVFDSDMAYDGGEQYHPAFRLDASTVVPEILVGLFPVSLTPPDLSGNTKLLTIPYAEPDTSRTHDQARAACSALGDGFHMMTIHEWGAVAFWAFNLVQNLRGNNSANVITDQEYGIKSAVTDTQILTGTGPLSWKHNGREFGISDLVAGVQEMMNLCRVVDAKVHFPFYNEFWSEPADWDDQGVWFGPSAGGDLCIRGAAPNADDITYDQTFSGMEGYLLAPGSLPASVTDPRLCELMFWRIWATDGEPPTDHEIAWLDNRTGVMSFPNSAGTRYLIRGGAYADGADAGLPTMRSMSTTDTGFQYRVAWIDPSLVPA